MAAKNAPCATRAPLISFWGALVLAFAGACRSSLPQPAGATHPDEAFVDVPYPPPAGRVEVVPQRPSGGTLWIDGQWNWDGSNWAWDAGGWVVPPKGGKFAPWTVRRQRDGRLEFAPATWRDESGHELPSPPLFAASSTREPDGGAPVAPPPNP